MYSLLEFKEQPLADYLNLALRRHGLNCEVVCMAVDPHGNALYSIVCFMPSEMNQARHLIYTSSSFMQDIDAEAAIVLREIRRENNRLFLSLFTSRTAIGFSIVALAVAVLGYLFGW